MEISLNIQAGKLLEAFAKAPQAVRDHLRIAVKSSTVDVQREARKTHRFKSNSTGKGAFAEKSVTVEFPDEMTGRVFLNTAVAQHVAFIHNGTRPHPILPKNASLATQKANAGKFKLEKGSRLVLRWATPGGKFAFARHVNHPGTKADPFLYAALEARQESIQAKMDKATETALQAAGL